MGPATPLVHTAKIFSGSLWDFCLYCGNVQNKDLWAFSWLGKVMIIGENVALKALAPSSLLLSALFLLFAPWEWVASTRRLVAVRKEFRI